MFKIPISIRHTAAKAFLIIRISDR